LGNEEEQELNKLHDIEPDPDRITESLRDTGYTLNTAIADIIDNSISAQASTIKVELALDALGKVRFSIADDGIGMNEAQLVEAFRYGSKRRDDPNSLGKFGLGLKTATTSFAKRLVVTSKSKADSDSSTFVFDLDRVAELGWKVVQLPEPDSFDSEMIAGSSGTIVRWQSIDRVLPPGSESAGKKGAKKIEKISNDLRDHLSMTFARFLDPADQRNASVSIFVNDQPLVAWNPFGYGAELLLEREISIVTPEGTDEVITVRAYSLPRKSELQAMFGPKASDDARLEGKYQGVYVYREGRMIHGPDWLGMYAQEPHFTLSRVELSFGYALDEAFQIDIKKSKITVDPNLEDALKTVLSGPRREAERRYREGKSVSQRAGTPIGLHEPANKAIEFVSPEVSKSKLQSTDAAAGSAVISNALGTVTVKYAEQDRKGVFVEAVDELPFNVFYEPRWINQNPGVFINKSHAFYTKVYLPNLKSGVTIQALDSLLWALANAEFDHTQEATQRTFEDMRFYVSRALEQLVADLPEPKDEE
jgi:hypothetical protein